MFARLALESDFPALLEMGRAHTAEILPDREFNEEGTRRAFERYLTGANPTVFVIEQRHEIVAYLVASIHEYAHISGFGVEVDLLYVRPDKRGTRAAALVMRAFCDWLDVIKPDDVTAVFTEPTIADSTIRFMRRFGFKDSGVVLTRTSGAR